MVILFFFFFFYQERAGFNVVPQKKKNIGSASTA